MDSRPCSDPAEALRYNANLRDVLQSRENRPSDQYDWLIPSVKKWVSEPLFCLLAIRTPLRSTSDPKDICVELIQLLQEKHVVPVVWVLQDRIGKPTVADILNSLNMQLHRSFRTLDEQTRPSNTSTTVHIEGISLSTTKDDIKDFFRFCGKIRSIHAASTNKSPQFTIVTVTFENHSSAKAALFLDNARLVSNTVRITLANPIDVQDRYTPKTDENECLRALETLLANISEVFVIIDQDVATRALQGRDDASSFWSSVFLPKDYSGSVKIALVGTSGPLAAPAGMSSEAARKFIIEAEAPRMTQVLGPQSRLVRNPQSRKNGTMTGREALAELIESLNIGKQFNESDHQAHGVTQSLDGIDRSTTSTPVISAQSAGSGKSEVSSVIREVMKTRRNFELFDVQTESMNL